MVNALMENCFRVVVFLLFALYFSFAEFTQFEDSIKYAIKENQPGQIRIGKISEDVSFKTRSILKTLSSDIRFKLQKSLSMFSLDPVTSVLRTKLLIDLEELCPMNCPTGEMGQLDLVVNVWDHLTLKGIIKVEINIQDVNDNAPTFLTTSIMKNVKEVIYGVGKSIELQKAIDRDISREHNKVTYDLELSDSSDTFELKVTNDSFPILNLKKALDYERKKIYHLVLWAWNANADVQKTKLDVTIRVLNINDMEPKFKQSKYEVSIDESMPINSMIIQVEAVDEDEDSDIVYKSTDFHSNIFTVSTKGQIFLRRHLDYESVNQHIIDVQATDGEFVTNTKVIINVLDVNDEAPQFNLNPSSCRIEEGQPKNMIIGQIIIWDRDSKEINGEITCWEPKNLNNKQDLTFKPPLATGSPQGKYDLYTRVEFDREDNNGEIRRIIIICQDGAKNNPLTSTMTISLTVVDINDNVPIFSQSSYAAVIEESNSVNAKVIKVHASDKDHGMNGKVTYEIDTIRSINADAKLFIIDSDSGWISVTRPLDREKEEYYQLTVVAKDNGTIPKNHMTTCTVNITVSDINDHSPTFLGPTELSISENQPLGTLIGNLKAVDQDKGDNSKLTFSLLPNHNTHLFHLSPNGSLYSANKFDREIANRYCLQAEITDQGSHPRLVTSTICIDILDVNDNPPRLVFPDHISKYNWNNISDTQSEVIAVQLSVHENPGFEILKAEASDPDQGVNSQFQFRLESKEQTKLFSIDPFNGNLKLDKKLNRESIGDVHIQIIAEDNGKPSQMASNDILIKIQDIPKYEERQLNPTNASGSKSRKFQIAIIFSAASAVLALIFIFTVLCIIKPCNNRDTSRGDYLSVGRQFLCDNKLSSVEMQNEQYFYPPNYDHEKQNYLPSLCNNETIMESYSISNNRMFDSMGPNSFTNQSVNQFTLPRSNPLTTNVSEYKNTFSSMNDSYNIPTIKSAMYYS